jgi:hypothetical protein
VNPALVQLVQRGLPPGFPLAFKVPESALQQPGENGIRDLDEETDEETEALGTYLNIEWEKIAAKKQEYRRLTGKRARAKAQARENKLRRR